MNHVTKSVTGRHQNGDETRLFEWSGVTKSVTSLSTIYYGHRARSEPSVKPDVLGVVA